MTARKSLPLLFAYCGRDWSKLEAWVCYLRLAPFPPEEHFEGERIKALLVVEITWSFKPFTLRVLLRSDDRGGPRD